MPTLLLDTHVLLWANEAPERLSIAAVDALEDPTNDLFVSRSPHGSVRAGST